MALDAWLLELRVELEGYEVESVDPRAYIEELHDMWIVLDRRPVEPAAEGESVNGQ